MKNLEIPLSRRSFWNLRSQFVAYKRERSVCVEAEIIIKWRVGVEMLGWNTCLNLNPEREREGNIFHFKPFLPFSGALFHYVSFCASPTVITPSPLSFFIISALWVPFSKVCPVAKCSKPKFKRGNRGSVNSIRGSVLTTRPFPRFFESVNKLMNPRSEAWKRGNFHSQGKTELYTTKEYTDSLLWF